MSLTDCLYQSRSLARLERARLSGRIPHSMIFHGPAGVGKSLLAKQWAKLMCCQGPIEKPFPQDDNREKIGLDLLHDCCDTCSDCHLAESGGHPDIHIVNRESARHATQKRKTELMNLPIDVIREFVIEPSTVRPTRGKARVFIIEEAETMNRASQNALLKTLEEPPSNTYIILITSKADMFLPTIRSRCQLIRFDPLPIDFVAERLQQHSVDPKEADYWASFSQGRLGLALQLSQTNYYNLKCIFVSQLAQLNFHSLLSTAQWIVEQAKQYSLAATKDNPLASSGQSNRQGQSFFLEIAAETFRTALRGQDSQVAGQADQAELLAKLADRFPPKACAAAIDATSRAQRLIDANVNATLIFESLMLDYLDAQTGLYANA